MKIELKKINGKGSGKKINIPDTIFNIKPNDHAIYLDIKNHLGATNNVSILLRSEDENSTVLDSISFVSSIGSEQLEINIKINNKVKFLYMTSP